MIDQRLIDRASDARREEQRTPLSAEMRGRVAAELAATFVEHSEGLEGYSTTAQSVKKSAEVYG